MISGSSSQGTHVVVGVDTHKDEHVAVAIDEQGVRLGEHHVVTTRQGYAEQPGGDSRVRD